MLKSAFLTIGMLIATGIQADTIVTDFEFDASSPFSVGTPPLTATFTGGDAAVPANPALVTSGTHAWLIPEGSPGLMTFEVGARGVFLLARTENPAGGEARIYNVNDQLISTQSVSDEFNLIQASVGNNPGVDRVEFQGFSGSGILAVDDLTFIAETTPTEMTVLYTRPDNDYSNVTIEVSGNLAGGGGPVSIPCTPTTSSAFGCFVEFEVEIGGEFTYAVLVGGVADPAGPITVDSNDLSLGDRIFTFSGSSRPYIGELPALPMDDPGVAGPDEVILHYIRPDGNYSNWGLHLWQPGEQDWTNFTGGEYFPIGIDPELGAYFRIALPQNTNPPYSGNPAPVDPFPAQLGFIIHRGNEKDPGPDQFFEIATDGNMLFVQSGIAQVFTAPPDPDAIQITGAGAHWVTRDTLIWDPLGSPATIQLLYSATGNIEVIGTGLGGQDATYTLSAGVNPQLPNALHLAAMPAWTLPQAAVDMAATLARGQLIAVALDSNGDQLEATEVQFPLLLDDLYAVAATSSALGPQYAAGVPTLNVWAPSANAVSVNIYDQADAAVPSAVHPMSLDSATGIWSITGDGTWDRKYYTYVVNVYVPNAGGIIDSEVTDPYSVNLSMGSAEGRLTKSQIVNLDDPDLKPAGWESLVKPALPAPEDIVLIELQVRDFSARDMAVAAENRGKYTAFADPASTGRPHFQALADAGLSHVHLLPAFDIATVNEDPAQRVELGDPVEALCAANAEAASLCVDFPGMSIVQVMEAESGTSDLQQQITEWMRELDGFNWGYDPYHYSVPEGSYSTDPDGTARVLEFRAMVSALNDLGLRTIMDVVYNHTNASGHVSDTSVLDKVVPGYYHRRNQSSGVVLGDSCCQDTASEHAMMEKLMIDSVVQWARAYKVDGFRFDLMGFHPLSTMENLRDALQSLTVAEDGVDGSAIYVYGEGWNFGDVANDRRFVQATQANMNGTGIGSFNDRERDGVRGGGPFDGGIAHIGNQGLISGLYYDPNALNSGSGAELSTLRVRSDWVRAGMMGNLADYVMEFANGAILPVSLMDYNGQNTGYTADPQEIINYVEAHDNETLWDISQYKHPTGTPTDVRVRAQNLGASIVLLGQGIPFLHAGQELLRSKSMDRDSFDSGDWYNRLDYTYTDSNFAVGEPRNSTNSNSLPEIRDVLAIPEADPAGSDIQSAYGHVLEMLQLRSSSTLFRLASAAEVMARVSYHNTGPDQVPGVIVQRIDGCVSEDYQPETGTLVTVINAADDDIHLPLFASEDFDLHPVLANSSDPVVRSAKADAMSLFVPARTTAVFEALAQFDCADGDADADGLPDVADNCIYKPNSDQLDTDGDGIGNFCDADLNNDCLVNFIDLGAIKAAFITTPADPDWNPEADMNGDLAVNFLDLGLLKARFFQDYMESNPSGVANACMP